MSMQRVGVDTGGTFTDLVALTDDGLLQLKVPSTPADPSRAVLDGLNEITAGTRFGPEDRIAHGTTVATNALLTGNVAVAALVTTAGFEDVLEIGRQERPALYDLSVTRPAALIPRERRLGLAERIGPEGEVEEGLEADGEEIEALLNRLAGLDPPPDAIAVCLLHAYANPDHEELVEGAVRARFPGFPLTLSSRLIPVYREYERTSTVVVNACVQPVMGRYLERLEEGAGEGRLIIIASSGGALSAERAAREPVHTLLSGPAAGVAGALAVARRAGFEKILTFDMGGTSTDVALCDGAIRQTAEGVIGGRPIQIPQVDMHTVGAGGGSLARIDLGGALIVGPESAGADPGPLAYGKRDPGPDGEGVTVTDANLTLGRLPEQGLLGGSMPLNEAAAFEGLDLLAEKAGGSGGGAGVNRLTIAQGVVEVAVTSMAGALRRISVERGKDPREYVLVAFGGAGAMHAAALARQMGVSRVMVPREPGLLSAVGTLVAGMRVDRARTVLGMDPERDSGRVGEVWHALEKEVRSGLEEAGVTPSELSEQRSADLRYRGQSFELTVPAGEGLSWKELSDRFEMIHEERYGYRRPSAAIELVSLRVEGHGPPAAGLDELLPSLDAGKGDGGREPGSPSAKMYWEGASHDIEQIHRDDLGPGAHLRGPLVIHEFSATTVVPPDAELEVGPYGDLLLTL